MTNFEKVKEEMKIEDVGTDPFCDAIYRIRKELSCHDRTCEECKQWLAEEYVEPIVLTEAERIILENLDKAFKYIARDKDGKLYVYQNIPTKSGSWWANCIFGDLSPFRHLFQFIKWEDDAPYEIAELLKGE